MKIFLSSWTALLTLLLCIFVRFDDGSFVESVRLRYFDQLITSKETTVSKLVHVVNIDDETIRLNGQFPFPRGEYSKIISNLYSRGAGLVVFNIYMPEPDRFGQDTQLAKVLKEFAVVLPHLATNEKLKNDYIPFRPGVSVIGTGESGIKYESIQPNIKLFNDSASGIGVVNTLPEIDGITRRMPMVVQSEGLLYPSISFEILRVASGDPSFQVKVTEFGIEAVRIPKFGKITTDQVGRIWIDWSSKPIEHSVSKLPDDFGGGIVIVGLTAKGLNNPVATAAGAVYPHYLQASLLDTVISGTNISRPDWADGAEILTIVLVGIILLFLTRYVYFGLFMTIATIVAMSAGSYYMFVTSQYLLDITLPIFAIVVVSLHAYGVKFVSEFLQKQQIKKQFGSYVSPVIVERLQKNPELIKLGGQEKVLSVIMTDMRNFTGLGEKYGSDVEGFTQIMNEYMTAISEPVFANDGCLIKFIGDASLHIHGAPLDDDRHAYRAVKTAMEMVQAVDKFNDKLVALGKPKVGMGAGVNTGKILVGNIGSTGKMGYDVLGDPVSVAARLEGQTKGYGVLLIIGPDTYQMVKDEFFCLELDCIAVKGKSVGLNIYTPLTMHPGSHGDYELGRLEHDSMLQCYRSQKFDDAITMCQNLHGEFDGQMDQYYDIWIERCLEMKKSRLPKDWDGIYRATSK